MPRVHSQNGDPHTATPGQLSHTGAMNAIIMRGAHLQLWLNLEPHNSASREDWHACVVAAVQQRYLVDVTFSSNGQKRSNVDLLRCEWRRTPRKHPCGGFGGHRQALH